MPGTCLNFVDYQVGIGRVIEFQIHDRGFIFGAR